MSSEESPPLANRFPVPDKADRIARQGVLRPLVGLYENARYLEVGVSRGVTELSFEKLALQHDHQRLAPFADLGL